MKRFEHELQKFAGATVAEVMDDGSPDRVASTRPSRMSRR